jgi:microcystin-dependent protein
MTVRKLSLPGATEFPAITPVTPEAPATAAAITPTETGAISTSSWSSYTSGVYQTPNAYNLTWENPIPLSSLFKNLSSIPVKDAKRIVSVFEDNAKSLEDHLDSGYLKVSGGTIGGPTTFGSTVNFYGGVNLAEQSLYSMLPPVGSIMPYAGTGAPLGWLLCDGTAYIATTYPSLYSVLGSAYNTSTGLSEPPAGYFRVPNLKARMPVGVHSEITAFNTRGKSGGSTTVTITVAQLPEHSHSSPQHGHGFSGSVDDGGAHTPTGSVDDGAGGHSHLIATDSTLNTAHAHSVASGNGQIMAGSGSAVDPASVSTPPTYTVGIDGTHDHNITINAVSNHKHTFSNVTDLNAVATTGPVGSGNAVDNMSPYLVLNYIIKT